MNWLEVGSSIANFIGAGLLAMDAFRARSNAKLKSAARLLEEKIRELQAQRQTSPLLAPETVAVTEQLERALAERTRSLTIAGFAVLTIGFFLDLVVKLRLDSIFRCGTHR